MLHKNTVFGYNEASKSIGSQNMSVGGVLGFENYSTRFNLKNVTIGNRFYRSYRILEKIEFSSYFHFLPIFPYVFPDIFSYTCMYSMLR